MAAELLSTELAELEQFANALADAARTEILPYWRKPIDVESKIEEDRAVAESPVTVADRNAEDAMRKLIRDRFPTHGIYGEEFGEERVDADWVWVLDPIDGTKSFITGKPTFGTLIGLLHKGKPVIGVIDQCVLDERWVGVADQKTSFTSSGNTTTVVAKGCTVLHDAMMFATTPHMFAKGLEASKYGQLCAFVKRPIYGCDCYAYALVRCFKTSVDVMHSVNCDSSC
eukprot:SAG31_NODE_4872_length_2894_cov_1.862612_2_plen_228_part_00